MTHAQCILFSQVDLKANGQRLLSLTPRGLYSEQLRHLLTKHFGKLPLDLLPTLYYAQFGKPKQADIVGWLKKKPIRWAAHVVHLAATQWVVWAPTSRPYPHTRCEPQSLSQEDEEIADPDDLLDLIQESKDDEDPGQFKATATIDFPLGNMAVVVNEEENQNEGASSSHVSATPNLTQHSSIASQRNVSVCTSGYGSVVHLDGEEEQVEEKREEEEEDTDEEAEGMAEKPSDPLQEFACMTPDEVLEEMRKELKVEDGESKLSKMDRYLTYFGELSGREIARVEALQAKKVRPRVPRQKPQLAIRFTSEPTKVQSVPQPPVLTEFERQVEEIEKQRMLRKKKITDSDTKHKSEIEKLEENTVGLVVKTEKQDNVEITAGEMDDSVVTPTREVANLALEDLIKPLPELPSLSGLLTLDGGNHSNAPDPFFGAGFSDLPGQRHGVGVVSDYTIPLLPKVDQLNLSTGDEHQ